MRKPLIHLILAVAAMQGQSILAAQPPKGILDAPARIRLEVPKEMETGGKFAITIRILDAKGGPATLVRDMVVRISAPADLRLPGTVTVEAGTAEKAVGVSRERPGILTVKASAPGIFPGSALLVWVAPEVHRRRSPAGAAPLSEPARPSGTPGVGASSPPAGGIHPQPAAPTLVLPAPPQPAGAARPAPGSPGLPHPLPPVSIVHGGLTAFLPVGDQGHLELIAEPEDVYRGPQGWEESHIVGFWFVGKNPSGRSDSLRFSLEAIEKPPQSDLRPRILEIPAGDYRTAEDAIFRSGNAGTARVKALYSGGAPTEPITVRFLAPTPAGLRIDEAPQEMLGLATVKFMVRILLVGADGTPAEARQPTEVALRVAGLSGSSSQSAIIAKGSPGVRTEVRLSRHGAYALSASAAALLDSQEVSIRYRMDWALVGLALLGGVMGSGTSLLWRERRRHGRTMWHARKVIVLLFLGAMAALLVFLLASFDILSAVEDKVAPSLWKLLGEIPATNLVGAFLMGFIAGLAFERVLGPFVKTALTGPRDAPGPRPAPS